MPPDTFEALPPRDFSVPTEEDLLDMQENLSRDPRATRHFNFALTAAYLLIVSLLVAGFISWHHWLAR